MKNQPYEGMCALIELLESVVKERDLAKGGDLGLEWRKEFFRFLVVEMGQDEVGFIKRD